MRKLIVSITLSLLAIIFEPAAADQNTTPALFINYQQSFLANPLSGTGEPPTDQRLPLLGGVANYSVLVQFVIEELLINDSSNSIDIRYLWHLEYNDSSNDTAGNCSTPCSTEKNQVLNMNGENACCTAIYVPNAKFANLRGTRLSSLPQEWYSYGKPDSDEAHYICRSRSKFNANLGYKSYPFERQKLAIFIGTDFIPLLRPDSFVLAANPQGQPSINFVRYASTDPSKFQMKGWSVLGTQQNVVATNLVLGSSNNLASYNSSISQARQMLPGVAFTITLQREPVAFYVQILVLPLCLMMLMIFGCYFFDISAIKGRMDLLSAMFFAMLILQYSIRTVLPAAILLNPYLVCIITYSYVFVIATSFLLLGEFAGFYEITDRQKRSLRGRLRFAMFQRQQLKYMQLMKLGGRIIISASDEEISRDLDCNYAAVDKLQEREKEINGPWYLRRHSKLFLKILQASKFMRWVDKWVYCMSQSSSKEYCTNLVRKVEMWIGVVLFVSFYVVVAIVYTAQLGPDVQVSGL